MQHSEKIEICINLINWLENENLSNQEILTLISTHDYVAKAEYFDQHLSNTSHQKSLLKIVQNIKNILHTADTHLPIHNQRYAYSYLDIKDILLATYEDLQLSTIELLSYHAQVEYVILQLHFSEYIIEKLLLEDNVKKSLELVLTISDKQYHYSAYRLIATYFAHKGDKENFMKILKKCDARKDVYELEWIKEIFIKNYSIHHSLENVFQLIERKEFGKKYLVATMLPLCKIKTFEEMKKLISLTIFDEPKLYLRPIIMTYAFTQNKENQTNENFEYLKTLLLDIPSKVRYGNSDFSMNDNLWCDIARSLFEHDIQKFKREWDFCIKKINSKIAKREMSDLLN